MSDLAEALKAERLGAYARLRGGFPIPLAGAVYWAGLGVAGYFLPLKAWVLIAFIASGSIFPLALLFAAIFRNPFMKDRTAVGSVLVPAFISMLLFWPAVVVAYWTAPELAPLILAIGMSQHWPVIGWSYGRTALFSAHAIVRAVIVFYFWMQFPEHRTTWLPFSVAAVYLATVLAIYVDSGAVRAKLAKA